MNGEKYSIYKKTLKMNKWYGLLNLILDLGPNSYMKYNHLTPLTTYLHTIIAIFTIRYLRMRVIWYSEYEIADGIIGIRSILVFSADICKKHIPIPTRKASYIRYSHF